MRISKSICLLQIGVQFFYSSLCVYSFSFEAIASPTSEKPSAQQKAVSTGEPASASPSSDIQKTDVDADVAGMAAQAGDMLQNDDLSSTIVSGATGKAAQSVEDWLNQFGTAQVKVSTDNNFSLEEAELDLLLPFYDDKTNLFFTQLGSRRVDDRNIINTGLGYRHFSDKWMWGANTFYDRQISENHHQRLGIGSELGWDYLKVSANGYLRLSEWMASSRYEDYDERAANGFDIRTEGYLPAWPQLGASIVYEQYFGNNVDLFNDDDNRQKDPYAVTVGLNYTPFPLMTAGMSQKMGKGDTQDIQVNLSFSYAPSVSLDKQLDPSQVAVRRSLLGSRQDLVNRNNTIVLDYRKQDLISLGLPDKMQGTEGVTLPVHAVVNSKYGLEHIDWQAAELTQHGGKITQDKNSGQYSITLPAYQYGGENNHYIVSGKAYDAKGNGSNISQMNVYVTGYDASVWQASTTATPTTLIADGTSTSVVTVRIAANGQQPVTGVANQLSATLKLTPSATSGSAQTTTAPVQNAKISGFTENAPGVYTSTFTSGNVAGTADVTPVANGTTQLPAARIVLQNADTTPVLSTLSASKTSALANGVDAVQLTAKVLTPEGLPAKGVKVSWSADNASAQLSSAQSVSDDNGLATLSVSSMSVLNTTVSAHLEQGESLKSDVLSFGADTATAQVMSLGADKIQATANNTDKVTLVANVVNAQNQPLTGAKVDWMVEQGSATLSAEQSTTDEKGNAQLTMTSGVAGDVVVSARSGTTEAKKTEAINFAADNASMAITSLTTDKAQALANGTDAITYRVTVTDANGNKVQGAPVSWSSDVTTAKLSASNVTTDAQGEASIQVTTTTASNVIVSAKLAVGSASPAPSVTFTADASTTQLSAVTADKTQALANGADLITLSTKVTDAQGNILANTDVNWSTNPATGTLSGSSTKTNVQGIATVTLASNNVSDYVVTASANGVSAESSSLVFAADAATAKISTLTADKTTGVVAGKDKVTLTAIVVDANNHPVQGATVNWSSDNSTGQFTSASSVTNAEGVATTQFSGTQVQTTTITAAMSGSSKTQSIDLIADAATATVSNVVASKSQALANGADTVTWTATVKDANQNPLNNMAVNWSSDNASLKLSGSSSQTNSGGVATITATSVKTADAIMTAALTTPAGSASASKVSYIADASTTQLSAVTADKTQALANGTDLITLSTKVTDAQGNILANTDVNWSTNPATGTLSGSSTKTNAQGIATVTLSSTSVSDYVVTASTNGVSAKSSSLVFAADAATAKISTLTADKTTGVVAGKDIVTLTATLLDANNHPVQGATVNWSSDNSTGQFTPASSVTNAEGVATAKFSETKADPTLITATSVGGSKTLSIDVIANAATATVSNVVASKSQALANGADTVTWTATVKDANQNPVNNMAVKWSSDNASLTLSGSSSQTNTGGVATITATSVKTADAIMTAALTTPAGSASASKVSYIADASTTQLSAVTADKTQALANGTDLITLSTKVTDAQGNILANTDVNWSTNPATGTLSGSSTKTNEQGIATVTLSSTNVSDYVVTASTNGVSAKSSSLVFAADAATAKISTLTADKTTGVVAGKDTVTLTAIVVDAGDHPVPNMMVTWSSDNNDGTFTMVSGSTDAEGVATAQFIATKVQTTIITVRAGDDSKTLSIDLIADAATATVSNVVASKSQALANGADTVTWTATVKDANQNPVNNMAVNWSSDNASLKLSGSSSQTNSGGVATITATSVKTADAIMTAALTTPAGSASASKVSYIADASTTQLSAVTADKTQALANGTDLITLSTKVTDAQGNILANTDVNWSTNPATGTLSGSSTKTNAQGIATVTLSSTSVSDYIVTASTNGVSAKSSSLVFAADAATAKISTLTADKTTGVVAGKDIVTLTATLLDANNHPVQGATVNWSSDNASGIITPVSGVTNASGVVSATLTSTLAQSTVVTASAGSSQKTLPVEFIADASSAKVTIVADKTQVVANGTDAVTWSATVLDANNNPVNGASVDWSRDNANVTLAGSTSQTQANGKATMTGTSLKTGTAIATATLTEQQSSAQATAVTYIADVSTAKLNLTVDRPSVSADGQDFATYKATAMDANDNPITNTTVNWATTLNKLTASSSVTDSSGVATVGISGTAEGNATVTVSLGDASQTNSDVTFVTKFNVDWVIAGYSGKYSTDYVKGHPNLGFIANAPTTGPTSILPDGDDGVSTLTIPMTDEKGNEVTVTFGGQRETVCTKEIFNASNLCRNSDDTRADLSFTVADNKDLPAGVYHGTIHFSARTFDSSVDTSKYEVNVLLTVK